MIGLTLLVLLFSFGSAQAELIWSTYLGGENNDGATAIEKSVGGNFVVAGYTHSPNFPVSAGAFNDSISGQFGFGDVFVAEISRNGHRLLWSTFLGGYNDDTPADIDIGPNREIIVAGITGSGDFPTTDGTYDRSFNGIAWDAFVTTLSGDGNQLIHGTFIGGEHRDEVKAVSISENQRIIVVGQTGSVDFPVTEGAFDASFNEGDYDVFVFSLTEDLSELEYSTFLGGTGWDYPAQFSIDKEGEGVVIVGYTGSNDFPVSRDAFDPIYNDGGGFEDAGDAFVARLSDDGSELIFGSFFGGEHYDAAQCMDLDQPGNILVAGSTGGGNFPVTEGAFDTTLDGPADLFVISMSPNGEALEFCTFLGGREWERAAALIDDDEGGILIAGSTLSDDFPSTDNAFDQSFNGGVTDAFLSRISTNGRELLYSTFLGGSGNNWASCLLLDGSGGVVLAGSTDGWDFPVTPDAFDTSYNYQSDVFITRMNDIGLTISDRGSQRFSPETHMLYSPYPNPFNSTTTIRFGLHLAGEVTLSVWDLSGHRLEELAGGVYQAGYHEVVWKAEGTPAGIYLVTLETEEGKFSQKVTLVK